MSEKKNGLISRARVADLSIYQEFFELSPDLMCVANTEGIFVIVNPAFTSILGYSFEELTSRPFISFVHPDDLDETLKVMSDVTVNNASTVNFENRYITKAGEVVHLQWVSAPPNSDGYIFAQARDITHEKKLRLELLRNEQLFNASQAVAKLGNFSFDAQENSLYWSPELYSIFEISDEEKENLYEAYIGRFDEEGLSLYESNVNECFKIGKGYAFEHKVHLSDGTFKIVSCVGVPFLNEKGEVYRIDGVVQDVTDVVQNEEKLKDSLTEKEFLIKELHHRVKNNLQVISSLLRLQAELYDDPILKSCLTESRNRIHSMASVHNLLYRSEDLGSIDFGHYVKKLTDDLGMSYFGSTRNIAVQFDIDEVNIQLEKAIPLGILMNELISNAFKHAFTEMDNALLQIRFDNIEDGLKITLIDNGVGFDSEREERRDSLGMNLVDSLAEELNGDVAYRSSPAGTTVELKIPLT